MFDLKIVDEVRDAYKSAAEMNMDADPLKVVPLVDAFLEIWPLAQKCTQPLTTGLGFVDHFLAMLPFVKAKPLLQPVETDLRQDLMPLLGGPLTVEDAAKELRKDLVAGAKGYNVAGAGHAVSRALAFLAGYVDAESACAVLAPYNKALLDALSDVTNPV